MKFEDGKFYLRKLSDTFISNPDWSYVNYGCIGKIYVCLDMFSLFIYIRIRNQSKTIDESFSFSILPYHTEENIESPVSLFKKDAVCDSVYEKPPYLITYEQCVKECSKFSVIWMDYTDECKDCPKGYCNCCKDPPMARTLKLPDRPDAGSSAIYRLEKSIFLYFVFQ